MMTSIAVAVLPPPKSLGDTAPAMACGCASSGVHGKDPGIFQRGVGANVPQLGAVAVAKPR